MRGGSQPLTAPPDTAHTPAVLQRVIDHQREPRQLLTLPFRFVGIAAVAYVFFSGASDRDLRAAALLVVVMLATTMLIEAAWWVTHRNP
jgi:hypothetical protein